MLIEVGCCEGSLRAHRHAEDPTVFTWDPHISRRSVENMGLHYVHPQKAPTNGEIQFEFQHDSCASVTNQHINDHSGYISISLFVFSKLWGSFLTCLPHLCCVFLMTCTMFGFNKSFYCVSFHVYVLTDLSPMCLS